jgi:hypothetical protein
MADLDKRDLDRHITGNWGEDSVPDDYGEDCLECGGEGWILDGCFEDTCCCADPENDHVYLPCSRCNPKGK